ncbi:unnamed protein product [Schistosoma curassoni]|nr:unnamed protein product [Schistosoma curassoni]
MVHVQKHGFTETVITREVDGDTLMTVSFTFFKIIIE